MMEHMKGYKIRYTDKSVSEINIDNIVTKCMMQHIQRFLKPKQSKSQKYGRKSQKKNKTYKK
jgi:hypothetical protein